MPHIAVLHLGRSLLGELHGVAARPRDIPEQSAAGMSIDCDRFREIHAARRSNFIGEVVRADRGVGPHGNDFDREARKDFPNRRAGGLICTVRRPDRGDVSPVFARTGVNPPEIFGLDVPEMFCEVTVMGRGGKLASKWLTDTLRGMSDGAEMTRLEDGREINLEAVTIEIERAIEDAHAQVHGPLQVCAWTRI